MYKYYILISLFALASCQKNGPKADAYGNFEADDQLVSTEVSGKILRFSVEEGQNLEAGQVVGAIDSIQLALRKMQLQASIRAVTAKSPEIAAQLTVFERQYNAIRQQLSTLEREQKRIENLLKSDAATPKQLDDIVAQIDAANKQLEVVMAQKAASNAALSTQKGGILAEVLPLQQQIAQIDDQLAKCRITNPVKGTVLVTYVNAGEITAAAKPLYKIADLDNMIFRAYVSGDQLGSIKTGQSVSVYIDGPDQTQQEFQGNIRWISPKAEFTPKVIQTKQERVNLVYAVKVNVKNPDGVLKVGMPGEMRFR